MYKKVVSGRKDVLSVTSIQGKLKVLWRHYEGFGKVSVNDNFEADWKEEVVSSISLR